MNHDGKLGRAGQLNLPQKYRLLRLSRRMVVVIVESDFTPGDDLWVPRQLFHLGVGMVGSEPGLVGMNADGRVYGRMLLRQANASVQFRRSVSVTDGHDCADSRIARARDHLLAIGVELLAIEMRV